MESRIGSSAVYGRLVLVLEKILNVSEFMVDGEELILKNQRALLAAHIIDEVKVPGTSVANDTTAIGGFLNDRLVPKAPVKIKRIVKDFL